MQKFPLLTIYRQLLNILGGLSLVVGILVAIQAVSQIGVFVNDGTRLVIFASSFIPFLILGVSLGIAAELIKLFLRIEDHLDTMRSIQEKQAGINRTQLTSPTSPGELIASKTVRKSGSVPRSSTASPLKNRETTDADILTLSAVVRVQDTDIYEMPGSTRSRQKLHLGDSVTLYGRSLDKEWLEIEGDGQHWVSADALNIDGDLTTLPIVEPG